MHGRFLVTASTERTDISDPTLLADAGAIPILVSLLKQSNEASLIHSSSGTNVILPQNILVAIKCILKDAEKDRQSHLLTHAGGFFLPTLDAMRHWKDYEGVCKVMPAQCFVTLFNAQYKKRLAIVQAGARRRANC